MELSFTSIILIFCGLVVCALVAAFLATSFLGGKKKTRIQELLVSVLKESSHDRPVRKRKLSAADIEALKKRTRQANPESQMTTVLFRPEGKVAKARIQTSKFFQAGLYSTADRLKFRRFQMIAPIAGILLGTLLMFAISAKPALFVGGILLSLFAGYTLPESWLQRRIEKRMDETMYYLPLVIEQISIGVSSSLDLWPCISNILEMASARDAHNPVTELLLYVEKLIVSGLSLQDALLEVGQASGVTQIKHTFRYLAQCAEHGGEISKQLTELADSVMIERQTHVEGKVATLPVKASGPLFLVFAGFFVLMLSGILSKVMSSYLVSG